MKSARLVRFLTFCLLAVSNGILFLSAAAEAQSIQQFGECQSLFSTSSNTEILERRLGTKIVVRQSIDGDRTDLYLVDTTAGEVLGGIDFIYEASRELLRVRYIWSDHNYRGIGVTKVALSEALKRHPDAKFIRTSLTGINAEIVESEMNAGKPLVEAIKSTPAYKVRVALGFAEIVLPINPSSFGFTVKKSQQTH